MYTDTADLEFLTEYSVFERSNMIRRVSDLTQKVTKVDENLLLPKKAMLHIVDNIDHPEQSTDSFNPDQYPFLSGKGSVKQLYHYSNFDELDKNDLSMFSHRIIRSKLAANLTLFNRTFRKILRPVSQLDKVEGGKNVLVVNYNPLYRLTSLQDKPIQQYYRYRAIMARVLAHLAEFERTNILVLPIPDNFEYTRTNLAELAKAKRISPQKLATANHFYFFVMDLVTYLLEPGHELSLFSRFPTKTVGQINLMLVKDDKAVMANLGKLSAICDNKARVFQFVDQLVDVAKSGEITRSPQQISNQQQKDLDDETTLDAKIAGSVKAANLSKAPDNLPDEDPLVDDESEDEDDSPVDDIIDQTNTYEETELEFDDSIDDTFIARSELTPQQQEKAKILAQRTQQVKIPTPQGNKTVGDILNEPIDTSFSPEHYSQLDGEVPDPSMTKSATKAADMEYQEKLLQRDIIANLAVFQENGLFMNSYEEEDEYNSFTRVKHVKVGFQDVRGKKHTVRFKIPTPDDDGHYLINGVKLSMSKQFVNVPICKISPTRVSLISNFIKTLVDKVQSKRHSLPEYLAKNAKDLKLTIEPKSNSYIGYSVPYDYKSLGIKFGKIVTPEYELFFEYPKRYQFSEIVDVRSKESISTEKMEKLEKQHGVLFGRTKKSRSTCLFMDQHGGCTTVEVRSGNIVEQGNTIIDYLGDVQIPAEWCELKILDKNLPIIFVLGYRYGLTSILNLLKVKYRFVPARTKMERGADELVIPFKDGKLLISRYPLMTSYIVAGLLWFSSIKKYEFRELDDVDTYYHLLSDKGFSTNYLKGIDSYFNFFIDPITKDVLEQMNEPTTTRDLLIRAVEMLVYETDKEPSAIENFRSRSAEKIPSVIYNEISRQYANYVNTNYRESSFSINTEAVFQRILQDQTMVLKEETNPVRAMKEYSRVTYSGFGGRTEKAFVERDRRYADDAVGVLSEATPTSSSVGMVTYLTGDPKIKNLRGMFDIGAAENVTNKLSDTTLLMPFSTHDDPKRSNFVNVQLTHHIPTKNQSPTRLRTGYELVVPYKTSSTFAGKARQDGKVTKVDDKLKLVTVTYQDGTADVFEYGELRADAPGMGLSHDIKAMPDIKVGKKIKAGDLITYHGDFFSLDPTNNQLSWNHGVPAKVALMAKDVTLEDSCMITKELANQLKMDSVYARPIQVTTDMVVDEFVEVGAKVKYDSPLIRLQYESTADIIGEVDELFDDLRQVEYRSKHEGEVVDIQVFHVLDELNPSLTKFINKVTYQQRRKANATKGTRKAEKYKTVNKVEAGTRIKGVQLGESDLLVVFHIKSSVSCGQGDKIIFDGSLKTVIGKVSDDPIETDEGEPVHAVFGASGAFNRIILSPFIAGISEAVMKHAEKEVVKMYFEDQ